MSEIMVLLFFSSAMLIGCYLAGIIPLIVTLSGDKLQLVSVLGAGLLVGTALSVIIPEGVNTLYASQMHKYDNLETTHTEGHLTETSEPHHLHNPHEGHVHNFIEPHSVIGVALVLGFVFMLLIDQIGSAHGRMPVSAEYQESSESMQNTSNGSSSSTPILAEDKAPTMLRSTSSKSQELNPGRGVSKSTILRRKPGRNAQSQKIPALRDAENGGSKQDRYKITATLGLVVHAAADGIALGAAVTTSHTDIEMIVFTAIMLHKAPAAFGLVTFLMHEGLDRVRIRKHLLIFALAAPVLAILTYFGISQSTKERLSSLNATGMAMLFSAGTFLYVATVHVLPEITARSHSHSSGTDSTDGKGFRKSELAALIVGALLPLLLSIGHHH